MTNPVTNISSSSTLTVQNERMLWEQTKQHSHDYCQTLGLSAEDLEVIDKNKLSIECRDAKDKQRKGFLFLTISGKEFWVDVRHISGRKYASAGWERLIQVLCLNDSSVNTVLGGNWESYCINDQWHKEVLNELQGGVASDVRNRICAVTDRNIRLWKLAQNRSNDLCGLLGIAKKDLSWMRSCFGFAKSNFSDDCDGPYQFSIQDKKFKLSVDLTSGANYGGGWEYLVQVTCSNDPTVNEAIGGGTTLVNVVAEQWHRLFLDDAHREIFVRLKNQISDIASKNERIWKEVQQRSDAICVVLGCSGKDYKTMERCLPAKRLATIPRCFAYVDRALVCRVNEKEFFVCVANTYGLNYGDKWKNLMQVVCVNDESLNESIGGGTAFVNVIAEDWHQAFLDALKNEAVKILEAKVHTLCINN